MGSDQDPLSFYSITLSITFKHVLLILLFSFVVHLSKSFSGFLVYAFKEDQRKEAAYKAHKAEDPKALPDVVVRIEDDDPEGNGGIYGTGSKLLKFGTSHQHCGQVGAGKNDCLNSSIFCEFSLLFSG